MWINRKKSQETQVNNACKNIDECYGDIEARNLTRNKDIIMKTFQNAPVTIVTIIYPTEVI